MFRFITTLCLVLMLVAMVTACSSGGGSIIPDGPDGFSASSQLPVYLNPSTEGVKSGTGVLGVYQIVIDNSSLNYDVVPLRYSSFVPREFETDLTLALTTSFCHDCFKVNGVTLNASENILLDVGVKHPFPQVTTLPAPRPQRPDLHVFDVEGIVVVEGNTGFPRSGITLNPDFVVNPEGFTSVFDAAIDSLGGSFTTAANAHPFKILSMGNYVNPSDDIGNYDPNSLNGYPSPSGIMNPTGFNVMKGGCDYFNTTYELKSEGTSTSFLFVVTCSFGEAAKGRGSDLQKRDSPIYLLPAFSKPEAWKVAVDVENNGLADNDNTSTADIVIRVADWQEAYGATPANPAFDPSIDIAVQRNTLIHASGIHNVVVDIPSLNFMGDDALAQGEIPTGDSTYLVPSTYRITVNNDEFASEIPDPNNPPQFWGLVATQDDLAGTANPSGGIDRDLIVPDSIFSISDYTTYQVFGISIFPPNIPPTPNITCVVPGGVEPFSINSGDLPDFHGNASIDSDGAIVKYEWDFDYDNVTHNFADPSDPEYYTDGDINVAADPPPWKMNNLLNVNASKYVALRVTDDSAGATTSVMYVEVDIGPNLAPIPDLGVAFYDTLFVAAPYTFYEDERVTLMPGPLTSDDGNIVTYQYDFSYDGTQFYVEAANTNGAPILSPVQFQGAVTMATKVNDDGQPYASAIDSKIITVLGTAVNIPVQVSDVGASGVDLANAGFKSIAAGTSTIVCAWAQTGNMADIFYSVSSDNGVTWSAPARLNTNAVATQQSVSLTVNPATDTYYAAFEDNSGGPLGIAWAISDANCAGWQAVNQGLLPAVGTNPDDPSIAINPTTGQIYIAYIDTLAGQKEVIVQTSVDNGTTWNIPVAGINSNNNSDRTDPSITWNATGSQVGVAWDDYRNTTDYQIYFNWSNATGTAFQVADVQVVPTADGQNDPSLECDAGTWIMTYDDLSATTEIYFTSSADGVTWVAPVDITDNTDSVHNNSSLCIDGAGVYYVTTRDSRETGMASRPDVYIFKSLDNGVNWVRGVRANDRTGTENAYNPNIAGLPGAGGFVVMYESPDNTVFCAVNNAY